MKLSPGNIGKKSCYKIKEINLNPYKIRPITNLNGVFGTIFP